MKKSLILLVAVVAAALLLITVLRHRFSDSDPVAVDSAERQRVQSFWTVFNQANTFRAQSDFARAVAGYREALRLNPKHEDSYYYLGVSLEELGAYSQAVESFRQLIALNPSSGRAFGELGNALSLRAPGAPLDYAHARQAYQRNIQINGEQAGPFVRLGMLELDQGHFDAALERFRVAAGFGSPDGNFSVGYTLFLQKRYAEAVPYFRKVLDVYAQENKIAGRGVLSEGDIIPAPGKPLTPLERAALKSLLFLYWAAQRLGGYPKNIPAEFQLPSRFKKNLAALSSSQEDLPGAPGGRVTAFDLDPHGHRGLLVYAPGRPLHLLHRENERYAEITQASGLKGIAGTWNAYAADYDGDGYADLYLIRSGYLGSGQNLLFRNNRNGTFTDVTASMGLKGVRSTSAACFLDVEGHGRMDLLEVGAADSVHSAVRLFRNTGSHFVESTAAAGLSTTGTAVDCAVADYQRNGRPALFVLFWKTSAIFFANSGDGKFVDATAQAGLTGIRGQRFSATFFDFDNDGLPDLLVTGHAPFEDTVRSLLQPDFSPTENTPRLFRNRGNGTFEEVTAQAGLRRSYGTMQVLPVDADGDGWTDLLLVNGSLDAQRLEPSVLLRNVGGKKFEEWAWLPGFETPDNFIAAALLGSSPGGPSGILFSSNPILGNRSGSVSSFFRLPKARASISPASKGMLPK